MLLVRGDKVISVYLGEDSISDLTDIQRHEVEKT